MINFLVNLMGIILVLFIAAWFWRWPKSLKTNAQGQTTPHSNSEVSSDQERLINILVDNGVYSPANITAKVGEILSLRIFRKDPAPCAASFTIEGMNIGYELPLEQAKSISINTDNPGVFIFHCQKNRYRGTLTIEPSAAPDTLHALSSSNKD